MYEKIYKENTTLVVRVKERLERLGWRLLWYLWYLVIAIVVSIAVTELIRRIAPYFDSL